MPVEVGDTELRAGARAGARDMAPLAGRAREITRVLGR